MNPATNTQRWIALLCLLGAASILTSQSLKDAAVLLYTLALLSFTGATVLAVKRENEMHGTEDRPG